MLALASIVVVGCGGPNGAETTATEESATTETPAAVKPSAPHFREITLPEGTSLPLRLRSAVASDTSRVEDAVRAELREAVVVNGTTVLPAGTELAGVVT